MHSDTACACHNQQFFYLLFSIYPRNHCSSFCDCYSGNDYSDFVPESTNNSTSPRESPLFRGGPIQRRPFASIMFYINIMPLQLRTEISLILIPSLLLDALVSAQPDTSSRKLVLDDAS